MSDTGVVLDCEAGRRMGCGTFCCRLIVRLGPDEVRYAADGVTRKSCLDKDPRSGLCVHLDAASGRCSIWAERPQVCRAYDCNDDPKLQIVLREGFSSLVRLTTADEVPRAEWRRVPSKPRET